MNYFSNIFFLEIIEASKPTSSDNKAFLDRSFKERELILDFTNLRLYLFGKIILR